MAEKKINGFTVWSAARQNGDSPARAEVETKPVDGSREARTFTVITEHTFRTVIEAKRIADSAVENITYVSRDGVPSPLTY